MAAIHLKAVVGDDRKLVIQLPPEILPGSVDLVIHTAEISGSDSARNGARAKLFAAGALVTHFATPENARRLSIEERLHLGTMPADARPSLDLINEDRGEW
jgi:hypothetical protein